MALQLDPDHFSAHMNLGVIFHLEVSERRRTVLNGTVDFLYIGIARELGLQRYTDASVNRDIFPTIRISILEQNIAILR